MRVTVHDSGNPEKSATTTLTIPVVRNVHGPIFEKQNYQAEITENTAVGTSILEVKASDDDQVCFSPQHFPNKASNGF